MYIYLMTLNILLSFLLIRSYPRFWSRFPTCFMFPVPKPHPKPQTLFHSTLYHIPLVLFLFHYCFWPYSCFIWPCYVLFDTYMFRTSCMFPQSEINIDCPPWTCIHLIRTFRTLRNLCPSKLRTRERQVAKHQSLSCILIKPCHWLSSSAAPEGFGWPRSVSVCFWLVPVLNTCLWYRPLYLT